jgi:hypothetical protein
MMVTASVCLDSIERFADHRSMDVHFADTQLAGVAAAIAEPARARMLCLLMDGHARTGTELVAQGKHRYYRLANGEVAAALEALLRVAGVARPRFVPTTPDRLRHARSCYDHMAGIVAVALHDHMAGQGWLLADALAANAYALSDDGAVALEALGLDVAAMRTSRRRFACACLDWSERRPHVGGALGAALLALMLRRAWVEADLDSRALAVTREGKRQLARVFGVAA